MTLKKLIMGMKGPGHPAKLFLQPLTVALISLVLVSLALVTGLMDLRTLDKTLSGYMEKRGLDIIKNVQQAAKYNFHLLGHGSDSGMEGLAGSGLVEEAFSLREAMILELLALAQRIDFEREQGLLDDPLLASLAAGQGIRLVALLDAQGKITYKNRSVPEYLLESAVRVIAGDDGIMVDLFGPSTDATRSRSFAVRRKWGKGSILFALDQEDFRFWSARVSIERAVDEVGLGTDTRHFVVTDTDGRVLFQTQEARVSAKAPDQASEREGGSTIDVTVPLRLNGESALKAWLALSRETADRMMEKERQRGFVFIGFMVCIAILSIGLLYRSQSRHLANMREMERRLHRAERLSAMGRLAAGVAHEIRNPLNAMSMACQRLQKDNLNQLSKVIRDEIRRLNQIVEEFIGFSRAGRPVLKEEDITALIRKMAFLVEEEASSRGILLSMDLPEHPLMIWMDADKIRQALLNIMKNAMESISDRGTIALALSQEGKRWVSIRISDTGRGLSPEEMEQIFDPDYTTKEKGLGLGLALAHEIIEAQGGEIRVKSEPGRGTTFEVVLAVEGQGEAG
jgi:signal transduction histidine kinase